MGIWARVREPDLEPVVDEQRWSSVTSAPSDPVVALAAAARARADVLVDRAVARIVEAVPAYADSDLVDPDDLRLSVSRNLDLNLLVLAEHRDLADDEVAARAALGVRRAQAGLPISDLLRAFRVGYLVLWEGLTEIAQGLGRSTVDQLLSDAGRIWELLDGISAAVAEAHRETLAQADVDTRRRALAFVASIEAQPHDGGTAEAHARELGLDPFGSFIVAVGGGHASVNGPRSVCAEQPDQSVVIFQPAAPNQHGEEAVARRLVEAGLSAVGVGMVASGLGGARRSLQQAQQAHRCARAARESALAFRAGWFRCLVHESRSSLEALVGELAAEVRTSTEVRDTLAAVLAVNGNLTAASRDLHVHPNTVAYRLQRIEELTGFDVRAPGALLHAHLALALADCDEVPRDFTRIPTGDSVTFHRAGTRVHETKSRDRLLGLTTGPDPTARK